jgi:hypothetical protein
MIYRVPQTAAACRLNMPIRPGEAAQFMPTEIGDTYAIGAFTSGFRVY